MPFPYFSRLFYCLASAIILSGCLPTVREQAFYVSPFNGNSEDYHPMPTIHDSAVSAVYARAAYFSGSSNDHNTDQFAGVSASIYATNRFGIIQCFYGADFALGGYSIGTWDTGYSLNFYRILQYLPPAQSGQLKQYAGTQLFGSTAFSGGMNLVAPVGQNGEWRFLGVETALHREFGDYHDFRQHLPDSVATLVVHSRFFGTAGLTSEIIGATRNGELGMRLAGGWILGSAYHNLHIYDSLGRGPLRYSYFDATFHYTFRRYTAYFQIDGGTKSSSVRIGFVFRIGRPRLPEWSHRPGLERTGNSLIMP